MEGGWLPEDEQEGRVCVRRDGLRRGMKGGQLCEVTRGLAEVSRNPGGRNSGNSNSVSSLHRGSCYRKRITWMEKEWGWVPKFVTIHPIYLETFHRTKTTCW